MKRGLCLLLLAWACSWTGIASAEMLVQGYDAALHDRFYVGNDKAFIGDPYDWSGVGRTDDRWATMISPSYFVSANHYHPAVGDTVYFYYSNDPNGGYETRTVLSGQQIVDYYGNSDLWLGKLSAPVSAQVAIYPILLLDTIGAYEGRELYAFGLSNTSPAHPNVRLGRNNIDPDSFAQYTDGVTTSVAYTFDYNTTSGLGADECFLKTGDSGGPSFSVVNGVPALVGIHWFNVYTKTEPYEPIASGDTFVPWYLWELADAMVGEQPSVVIPEPGTLVLLVVAGLVLCQHLRLRRKVA